ncbi:hypothetical protein niasHT_019608 [Heterodera trifolii]|uniref:Uncharacterized protein n=1 Tax=Heterodera trifolii TaxID=157864 RepID=A0ABD2L8A1_9BILA
MGKGGNKKQGKKNKQQKLKAEQQQQRKSKVQQQQRKSKVQQPPLNLPVLKSHSEWFHRIYFSQMLKKGHSGNFMLGQQELLHVVQAITIGVECVEISQVPLDRELSIVFGLIDFSTAADMQAVYAACKSESQSFACQFLLSVPIPEFTFNFALWKSEDECLENIWSQFDDEKKITNVFFSWVPFRRVVFSPPFLLLFLFSFPTFALATTSAAPSSFDLPTFLTIFGLIIGVGAMLCPLICLYVNSCTGKVEAKLGAKLQISENKMDTKLQIFENKMDTKLQSFENKMDTKLQISENKMDTKLQIFENKMEHKFRDVNDRFGDVNDRFREVNAKIDSKFDELQLDLNRKHTELSNSIISLSNSRQANYSVNPSAGGHRSTEV